LDRAGRASLTGGTVIRRLPTLEAVPDAGCAWFGCVRSYRGVELRWRCVSRHPFGPAREIPARSTNAAMSLFA